MEGVWFLYLATASYFIPLIVARIREREIDRSMRLLAAWFALFLLGNAISVLVREMTADGNNLIVGLIGLPFEGTLVLLALADLQEQPLARTTVRFLVPLYLVLWVLAVIYLENPRANSVFAGPTLAFLALAASLFAFISKIQHSDRPILDTSWGWILPGIAIFYASSVSGNIVLEVLLLREKYDLMRKVLLLQVGVSMIATLMISWGFYWPTRPKPSGASSSPSPSP